MQFCVTRVQGAFRILPEPCEDERGLFSRTYCRREFGEHGLPVDFVQSSVSFSRRRGTLRGIHWQCAPALDGKLVRCTRGAVYDVVLDLRSKSPTYLEWTAVELTQDNRQQLYIPEGCGHGLQTLVDDCEVHYSMTDFYRPELQRRARWDDPAFGIRWPIVPPILLDRDRTLGDWSR